MADKTHIEWTDATWNVINGCTVVSPGCANCYAMRLAATRLKNSASREGLARMHNGNPQWTGEVSLNKKVSLEPMKWTRPRRIFVCAHGDLFHESVPDHWIDFVFNVMFLAPQHTYQVLTKRPARMREYMRIVLDETEEQTAYRFAVSMLLAGLENTPKEKLPLIQWPPPNAWLGTSVEDQQRGDERIPLLLDTPAAIRWLSCEPLLGPVQLTNIDANKHAGVRGMYWVNALTGEHDDMCRPCAPVPKLDWVVVGGESGPNSRRMSPMWAESLRNQCEAAGVPFLFKQWGDWMPDGHGGMSHVGKRTAGRLLDGVQHDGYPNA